MGGLRVWVIGVPSGRASMSGTGAWGVGGFDFMSLFLLALVLDYLILS